MSVVVTTGELAAAAGDAYGAYQGELSSPANQVSFGAAETVAAASQLAAELAITTAVAALRCPSCDLVLLFLGKYGNGRCCLGLRVRQAD